MYLSSRMNQVKIREDLMNGIMINVCQKDIK